ncbi:hypothetical protein RRG08_021675 [Elysia crispata]|uniref:Uncharacterized protein n=1 Tax=Elysia crispata TaxID=231223 RepID=A0AAE1DPJ3_9GAST|nr:hypothetical protein RRG08_021675 [Elysia crispata]
MDLRRIEKGVEEVDRRRAVLTTLVSYCGLQCCNLEEELFVKFILCSLHHPVDRIGTLEYKIEKTPSKYQICSNSLHQRCGLGSDDRGSQAK